MPTYTYKCKKCYLEFNVFQMMSDKPIRVCVGCKKKSVVRLLGCGSGVNFKGGGWYKSGWSR